MVSANLTPFSLQWPRRLGHHDTALHHAGRPRERRCLQPVHRCVGSPAIALSVYMSTCVSLYCSFARLLRFSPDFFWLDDYNVAALALLGSKPDVVVCDLNAAVTAVCGKGCVGCKPAIALFLSLSVARSPDVLLVIAPAEGTARTTSATSSATRTCTSRTRGSSSVRLRWRQGSVAFSRCTTAHPLHTRFTTAVTYPVPLLLKRQYHQT
jgi:hypothetical protein